ncbi:reverse transcriptase N-terminal domain-containing protein [Brenneria populi]|uniref:reverse transcriptase N-terminal domain-containing protein n=1 Tax=Brenneria populi TaxID=1505588 RepID=UPI0032EF9EF3
MTQATSQCGAPSASSMWSSIDWQQVEDDVFRLQMRIAKATKAQRWNKVCVLQRLFTRSHQAKLLAVKRATSNRGRRQRLQRIITRMVFGQNAQP